MVLQSTGCKMIHVPVMVEEVIKILNPKETGIYVDATLGCGGHSLEILKKLGSKGRIIGLDRDESAIACSRGILNDTRILIKQAKFSQLKDILSELNIEGIDGIVFDLGVSMLQLKDLSRGFSFHSEERLDMRMDNSESLTAWEVVNRHPEKVLIKIFTEYGDEPFARRIAREIVRQRSKKTIDTCRELANLITKIVPKKDKIHPATRVFQAIRIEVNRELEELREGLRQALEVLNHGGRICVISYHSGEDRVVKNFFRDEERKNTLRIITKKPLVPSLEEITKNPSARSARLRGGEKL